MSDRRFRDGRKVHLVKIAFRTPPRTPALGRTYRWHNHLSLEPSSDTVINTLGLSPACVDTFVGVALMSVETLRACTIDMLIPDIQAYPQVIPIAVLTLFRFQRVATGESRLPVRGGEELTYAS
jgi:hypothetical protein